MNSCQYSNKIIDYLLGLLKGDEQEEFEKHLADCAACQQELKLERVITEEFGQTMDPGHIEHIVLAKLRLQREMNRGFSWGYAVRGVAYGITAAILGMVCIPPLLSFLVSVLNTIMPMIPEPQFGWVESFDSITTLFSNLYVIGGIGIAALAGSIIYSLYVMKAQFSLSR